MTLARLLPSAALHRRILILVVSLAGFMASGAASAGFTVGAVCTGGGQLCNNMATFTVDVSVAGGAPRVRFHPGSYTCSNFRIHYLVDGTEVTVTGFVGPGQTTGFFNLGPMSAGTHTVGMVAEGEVSGCNVGNLVSWGGRARVIVP